MNRAVAFKKVVRVDFRRALFVHRRMHGLMRRDSSSWGSKISWRGMASEWWVGCNSRFVVEETATV